MILVIILLATTYIFGYLLKSILDKRRRRNIFTIPASIKQKYKKVVVPINKISILSNDYYEDEDINERVGVKMWDALDINRTYKSIHKYISVITYDKFFYRGKAYRFKSIPINLSETEIIGKLRPQEEIAIFYDENNIDSHYFDLSFLI